jgi:hypothetical protein
MIFYQTDNQVFPWIGDPFLLPSLEGFVARMVCSVFVDCSSLGTAPLSGSCFLLRPWLGYRLLSEHRGTRSSGLHRRGPNSSFSSLVESWPPQIPEEGRGVGDSGRGGTNPKDGLQCICRLLVAGHRTSLWLLLFAETMARVSPPVGA